MATVPIIFYWGGNIIWDPDEGVSYDAEPKGIYGVQLGTTLSNLEEMFMSKVASYGETVRLIFKCRYPYRQWQATSKYKILPINDDEALNTVLSIGENFEPPNCLEVYIDKEVVHNVPKYDTDGKFKSVHYIANTWD